MSLGMAWLLTRGAGGAHACTEGRRTPIHTCIPRVLAPGVSFSCGESLLLIFIKKVVSKDVSLILQLRTGPLALGIVAGAGIPVSWSHAVGRAAGFR